MNELQELAAAFKQVPAPIKIEYRLYYDKNGNALFKSGDCAPGDNYIVITEHEFNRVPTHLMSVQDRQLIIAELDAKTSGRPLVLVGTGTPVAAGHPALVIEETDTEYQIEYYGTNN